MFRVFFGLLPFGLCLVLFSSRHTQTSHILYYNKPHHRKTPFLLLPLLWRRARAVIMSFFMRRRLPPFASRLLLPSKLLAPSTHSPLGEEFSAMVSLVTKRRWRLWCERENVVFGRSMTTTTTTVSSSSSSSSSDEGGGGGEREESETGVDDEAKREEEKEETKPPKSSSSSSSSSSRREGVVDMRHATRQTRKESWEYAKGEPWGWLYESTRRGETIDNFPSQKNAILSDRVKTKMYLDHKKDPEKYSTENLAKTYAVREQRIMAILALKRREAEWIKAGKELDYDLEARFEAVFGTSERGAGERHYVDVPTYPSFEVLTSSEARERTPGLKVDPEKLALREERELVRTFKERLDFNAGVTGTSLKRESRRKHAAKRPVGGFGLLVTPLGKNAPDPYVAEANGEKRPLNDDEEVFRKQRTIKPRRRIG